MEERKTVPKEGKLRRIIAVMPEELIRRIRRGAELVGVDEHQFARGLVMEMAEAGQLQSSGRTEEGPQGRLAVYVPGKTVELLNEEAAKRHMNRSQYIRDMILGTTGIGRYLDLDNGDKIGVQVKLSRKDLKKLDQLALNCRVSRSQYIRNLVLGTPVSMPLYLDPDLSELEPVFQDLETVAQSMQDLVLRPDRTEEDKRESRRIQQQMLMEIRRIRLVMEEWGETAIADVKASFDQWQAVRADAGLFDVSAPRKFPDTDAG